MIKELESGDLFGEYSFFSSKPWLCTATSKDFTETLKLNKESFLKIAKDYEDVWNMYEFINDELNLNSNFASLEIKCYLCT